jgi:Ca2+:H+ antiporter
MATWAWCIPVLAATLLVAALIAGVGPLVATLCAAALIGSVFAAVHHAEVVAHRVGEPFGTLILAVAVTVIETSLILSIMFADLGKGTAVARDTIYAAVMIICNGVVGVRILAGTLASRFLSLQSQRSLSSSRWSWAWSRRTWSCSASHCLSALSPSVPAARR